MSASQENANAAQPPAKSDDAAGFVRLSRLSNSNSNGWRFNREELHERP